MLLLYIICQHNSQSIMKIIYNRTILCLFGFTQKNHSGPIISAIAVCIYMASAVHANIHAEFQCWSFQLSPYGSVVTWRTAKLNI